VSCSDIHFKGYQLGYSSKLNVDGVQTVHTTYSLAQQVSCSHLLPSQWRNKFLTYKEHEKFICLHSQPVYTVIYSLSNIHFAIKADHLVWGRTHRSFAYAQNYGGHTLPDCNVDSSLICSPYCTGPVSYKTDYYTVV
jgi:hypothetical protein